MTKNIKKQHLKAVAVGFALALSAFAGAAQTVYRCGDSYSQKPCAGSKEVDVDDTRSATQRTQTLQATQRDARAADALQKARLQEEAKPAQLHVTASRGTDAGSTVNAASAEPQRRVQKPRQPAHFTAIAPGTTKTKTKTPKRKKT